MHALIASTSYYSYHIMVTYDIKISISLFFNRLLTALALFLTVVFF